VTTAPDLFARAARGPVSVSELPEDAEGGRYELIDASLYVTPSADLEHQELCRAGARARGAGAGWRRARHLPLDQLVKVDPQRGRGHQVDHPAAVRPDFVGWRTVDV
jgi:hypothetical protein